MKNWWGKVKDWAQSLEIQICNFNEFLVQKGQKLLKSFNESNHHPYYFLKYKSILKLIFVSRMKKIL